MTPPISNNGSHITVSIAIAAAISPTQAVSTHSDKIVRDIGRLGWYDCSNAGGTLPLFAARERLEIQRRYGIQYAQMFVDFCECLGERIESQKFRT